MLEALIYIVFFLLVAIVAGNNLSVCCGSLISSRIMNRRSGVLLAIIGYSLGFLLEGGLLKAGLLALMPVQTGYIVLIALSVAFVVFLIAHFLRVPESLSITFTMAIVGIEWGYGGQFSVNFLSLVIAFWIVSAALCGAIAIIVMKSLRKVNRSWNVWNSVRRMKYLLIAVSFLTSFTLGANTVGFIFASTLSTLNAAYATPITILAIIVGSILLSGGELKTTGTEILPVRYLNALVTQTISIVMVQIGTVYSIPTSNTQTFTASLYGVGLSYRTRLLLKKPAFVIIFSWIGTALISLALGFAATYVIYHL